MDLAQAVVSAAAQQFKKECMAGVCKFKITIDPKRESDRDLVDFDSPCPITATPMSQHVLLQYKGMAWKLPRNDSSAWQQTIDFIYRAVTNSSEVLAIDYCSEAGIWVFADTLGAVVTATVAVGDEVVFSCRPYGWESLREQFSAFVMGMQYMVAAV